ncbi:MAG: alpha/beta hydrolase [Pirellulales bacterium]
METKSSEENNTSASKLPRTWWQFVRRMIFLYMIVPYLSLTLLCFVFQRKMMYAPTVAENLQVAMLGLDAETTRDVQIQTPDGETLNGWLLSPREADPKVESPLVIYFPGNASNRHGRIFDLREVTAAGFDLLIFDYRGYGDSTGKTTEKNLTADARLVWSYAQDELNYAEDQIVVFGESLGGAVTLSLWADDNPSSPAPAAVILNSTFASMPRNAAHHYPIFPFQYLVLDRWPSIDRIENVPSPITSYHGTLDRIVPVAHGKSLAQAGNHVEFIELPDCGHNNIPIHHLQTKLNQIRAKLVGIDQGVE